jgi:hypothetical protein
VAAGSKKGCGALRQDSRGSEGAGYHQFEASPEARFVTKVLSSAATNLDSPCLIKFLNRLGEELTALDRTIKQRELGLRKEREEDEPGEPPS